MKKYCRKKALQSLCLVILLSGDVLRAHEGKDSVDIEKLEDIVIYQDNKFHCAFPSVVRRPNGELLVAFRRAPDRRQFGEDTVTHSDPNSYLVLVRSQDGGKSWSREPETVYAHPFGGSQDPCMIQLRDNSILCTSYGWAWMPPKEYAALKQPVPASRTRESQFAGLGGYILRSQDGGATWQRPIIPPRVEDEGRLDIFGGPLPAFNRGAMCENRDGRLYWAIAANPAKPGKSTQTCLLISDDKGNSWKYSCAIAQDKKVTFNETSLYETPKGNLIAFMRTGAFDDHLCVARSANHGKSFEKWEDAGFQGCPFYAVQLPDRRVFLVYGYRHAPFGIRARILNPECTDIPSAPEIILRQDGGGFDLGYPWATVIGKDRLLVVYYFNKNDGPRYIAGTFISLGAKTLPR